MELKTSCMHIWQKLLEKMPIIMIDEFNSRTTWEKVIYIYSCLNGELVREWLEIYRALVEFVCFTSKCWYESLNINNS